MEPGEDWISEFVRRQDNIDPIRRIPNGALFQGTLIKGNQRLNVAQRIGACLLGLSSVAFGCMTLASLVGELRVWSWMDIGSILYSALVAPFSIWIGWKITLNAFLNNPYKFRHKKY